MRQMSIALIVLQVLLWNPPAQAEMYIWNNQSGFVSAKNCKSLSQAPEPNSPSLSKGDSGFSLASFPPLFAMPTRWESKIKNSHFVSVTCDTKDLPENYSLFEVFSADVDSRIAEVALDSGFVAEISRSTAGAGSGISQGLSKAIVGVPEIEGVLAFAVCNDGKAVDVYDPTLSKVLFKASDYESARQLQSFGPNSKVKIVNGAANEFINVQFRSKTSGVNSGWIAKAEFKPASQCADSQAVSALAAQPRSDTWTFPTLKRPTDSYKTGQRRFGAARSGGRLHAAGDLYRTVNEAAVSVSSGQVIRDRYPFYQGTYALEVRYPGGKVARYGEITGRAAPGIKVNAIVVPGQTVGYVGKVNSNCCNPMLHFEFYSGAATGSLSQDGNSYHRRGDLLNPTSFLMGWEKLKFGQSY